VEPMKHVHEPPLPTRNESREAKVNQASVTFVDLFRRVAADSQKEKLTNG
jgi:hypothetical protein